MTTSEIAKKSLSVFILTVPLSNAFAPHKWLPIPMCILLVEFVCITTVLLKVGHVKYERRCFRWGDLWLVCFLIWIFFSTTLSAELAPKSVNHLAALLVVIGLYFFFVKFLFALAAGPADRQAYHLGFLRWPLLITFVFVCLEFVDLNVRHLGVRNLLFYAEDIKEYSVLYAGRFHRARGFTSESGSLALFLNTFSPLVLADLAGRRRYANLGLFSVLYVLTLVLSFSAAGVFFLLCGVLVSLLVYLYDHRTGGISGRGATIGLAICLLFGSAYIAVPKRYVLPVLAKLSLSRTAGAQDRVNRWLEAIDAWEQHPITGMGMGSTVTRYGTGVVSLYLLLLREGGVPALALFVMFVITLLFQVMKMPKRSSHKYAYTVCLVAALGHYAVISDFWLPWIWLLFSLAAYDLALINRESGSSPVAAEAMPSYEEADGGWLKQSGFPPN